MLTSLSMATWSDSWSLRLAANSSANKLYSQLKRAICSVKTYNRFYNHLIHSAFIKVLYCMKDKKTTDRKTQGLLKSQLPKMEKGATPNLSLNTGLSQNFYIIGFIFRLQKVIDLDHVYCSQRQPTLDRYMYFD